tara:strand:+ start:9391 stop:10899 length:1509 start_codon:yes stop_codon:yes gene_type:complete
MAETLANQSSGRILQHESFDSKGFTTNNSLAKMRLTKADTLNPVITHLMGAENKKFPLTFLTEGQKGGLKKNEIEDVEYNWPVMGRLKKSDMISSHEYAADDKPGLRGSTFKIVFKSDWLKDQHTIISPNGKQARIASKRPVAGGYEYTLNLIYRDLDDYCPISEMTSGLRWSMTGGAAVAEAYSSGNESNKQAPGKLKNQLSILRKSYEFGGNISNRTTEFQFNVKGQKISYWMPFEEYQHELQFKEACEEHLWWSTYNRDSNGNITTIDPDTGFPIPIGGGVDDQIPHKDTYGLLTVQKIHNTVGDVLYGGTDTGEMEVVLFTGVGGAREFDAAIKRDANGSGGWTLLQGDAATKFVTGTPGSRKLAYGGYFNTYQHIDGHTITIRTLNLLDFGGRAENSPKHPISGLPLSSYEMYFVDMSTYDGERNVQMVTQKGRSMVRGIEQGMTLIKGSSFGDYNGNGKNLMLATDQDKSAVHFLKTLGVVLRRNTHCFKLSCDLS